MELEQHKLVLRIVQPVEDTLGEKKWNRVWKTDTVETWGSCEYSLCKHAANRQGQGLPEWDGWRKEQKQTTKKRNQEVSLVLGYSQCLKEGRVGVRCEAGLSRGLGDCGQLFPDKECQGHEGTLSLHLYPLPMGQGAPAWALGVCLNYGLGVPAASPASGLVSWPTLGLCCSLDFALSPVDPIWSLTTAFESWST